MSIVKFWLVRWVAVGLIALMVGSVLPTTPTAHAQGTVVAQVLVIVSQNLGIYPAPTQGQLDLGDDSLAVPMSYRYSGLDLNDSNGVPSCTSRVMAEEEVIIGWVGYRVIVTVQGRRYEFRTDGSGSQIIRCAGGQQVDTNFGAPASRGTTRSGWEITDQAMRHLSNWLELEVPITRQAVDAAYEARLNGEENNFPHRVSYRWSSRVFSNSVLNCPASGGTWNNGDSAGYLITLTVNGLTYQYRTSLDGAVIILCLGGRADPTSQGVTFAASDS
jgi:hypothetical protein